MEKTYKLLNHNSPLPIEEIKQLYRGYWVYLVNVEFSEFRALLSGRPVVMGSRAFDGAKDGIYDKFDADEYAPSADLNLLVDKCLASILQFTGDANE